MQHWTALCEQGTCSTAYKQMVRTMVGSIFFSWISFSRCFQYFCTGVWPARLRAATPHAQEDARLRLSSSSHGIANAHK